MSTFASPPSAPEAGSYGWHAIPRALSTVVSSRSDPVAPLAIGINDPVLALPETPLAKQVLLYAETQLPKKTFNHSMRVFCFGKSKLAIFWVLHNSHSARRHEDDVSRAWDSRQKLTSNDPTQPVQSTPLTFPPGPLTQKPSSSRLFCTISARHPQISSVHTFLSNSKAPSPL